MTARRSARTAAHPLAAALRTGLLLTALALLVVAHLAGVRAVPVLTGSMTPYAPAGSLVLTAPVGGAEVAVGDVVAFVPPAPYRGDRPVMHRVASTSTTAQGRAMTTRGDANAHDDPWTVALDGADLGRAVAVVPLLGHLAVAGPAAVLSLLAGAAALAVALRLLRRPGCACALRRAASG
ncbi:signal peptidase I [Quadrisphaera sp. INWT6]|uniref:signal peptidase I n=1 Tax=Quadrisphaera sp. INWT6 TaxID=2596917 RepID=UPI00189220C2|nr:signal peptidase I [Quadrisphaera sp. INWT6]MBF5081504.1 signal peptidase I [Quadrisphaera sp. INWT6]